MAAIPPVCDFNRPSEGFSLKGVDGNIYSFDKIKGPKGTLVMFICNHCPYVIAIVDRIVRDANELKQHGIGVVAICSNDATTHPDDSYENMQIFSKKNKFSFPYLHDEDQAVARAYEAVCTPDFFGYNANSKLQYRGRLDASRKQTGPVNLTRDLFEAMVSVAKTGVGPSEQVASMGCSIKWK